MAALAETADTGGIRKQQLSSIARPFVHSSFLQHVALCALLFYVKLLINTHSPTLLTILTPACLKSYVELYSYYSCQRALRGGAAVHVEYN